jgi:hypothetical protein
MKDMTPAQLAMWLAEMMGKLIKWVLDGTRPVESLEAVYIAIQAVVNNQPVSVVVNGTAKTVVATKKFLRTLGSVTVPTIPGKAKVLAEGKGIWFGDNFKRWIATGLQQVSDLPETIWQSFETMKLAWDREIVSELPAGYVFKRHEFCAYMARLVSLQLNGKVGILLSDGRANIFLVEDINGVVRTVNVYGNSGNREWSFGASGFDDDQWDGGYRVFAATAPSDT